MPPSTILLVREEAISPAALLEWISKGEAPAVIDVRSPGEFAAGHVPGAVNVPFTSVLAGSDVPVPTSRPLVVYCGHGPRAWLAAQALRWRGYTRVVYLRGHMAAWRRAGLREERESLIPHR
jgi:rhodanese-related sulfurtransferase